MSSRYSFNPLFWKDCGSYYLNTAIQGSDEWHLNRKNRLTASNIGAALGYGYNKASGIMETALSITNIKEKQFTTSSKFAMQHGVVTEPIARAWYSVSRDVEIREVGLAVPKWEPRIGASLDGDIIGTDGIIEIKAPINMYEPLILHIRKIELGWIPEPGYHAHIHTSHYMQMQTSMKVTNKVWCDYIVYATGSDLVYVERVYFNQMYWDSIIWPGITYFLDYIMEPLIAKQEQSYLFVSSTTQHPSSITQPFTILPAHNIQLSDTNKPDCSNVEGLNNETLNP